MTPTQSTNTSPPAAFDIAFRRLRDLISPDDARSFTSTTLRDVRTAAVDIERELQSRRSLRGFHRIQPFLTGIEKYSGVVEVLCQGTPYLPYIWAPIKLLLQIAQGHISALEKLIDAYAMIGEVMPRFDRFSSAFQEDPDFMQILGYFYSDILEFHCRSYKFFRQRAWKILFESLWKTFDLRFRGILDNLRSHRDLIDREANALSIVQTKAWRDVQLNEMRRTRAKRDEEIQKLEQESLAKHTREAVAWLNASEDQEDLLTKLLRRCHDSEAHWALKESTIESWLNQGQDSLVVWLNGKPGSGKSIICSKIVEHLKGRKDIVIIYYFCSHRQTVPNVPSEILRSLTTQCLAAKTELAPYILDTFANNGLLPSKKTLGIILEKLITSLSSVRLIVDGLDECSPNDHEEIIEDVLRIRGLVPGACKLLLSSRDVPSISKLLQRKQIFEVDRHLQHVNRSISSYINVRLRNLHDDFSSELIDDLGRQILLKARGMFLWVRLVISTLEDLCYERDIRRVIQDLPEELEPLYERIVSQICGDARTPSQRTAIRILQWIVVARRPLKRSDLLSGIILDNQSPHITLRAQVWRDPLKLCSVLLDIEEGSNGCIGFFHFTVAEYLRATTSFSYLQEPQAESTVSLACMTYLTHSLELVNPEITACEVRSAVVRGDHDLHLYANDHWCDHLMALLSIKQHLLHEKDELDSIYQSVERFVRCHNDLALLNEHYAENCHDTSRSIPQNSLRLSHAGNILLARTLEYRKGVLGGESRGGVNDLHVQDDDPTLFSKLRARYQSVVEEVLALEQSNDAALNDFQRQYGHEAFLCRFANCPKAIVGYSSAELRQQHEATHAQRFRCVYSACPFSEWTFHTRNSLRNHIAKYHSKKKAFPIPDNLFRRLRQQEERPLFSLGSHSSDNDQGHGNDEQQKVVDVGNALGDLNFKDLPWDCKQKFPAYDVTYNPAIPRTIALSHFDFHLPTISGVKRINLGCKGIISLGFRDRLDIYDMTGDRLQVIPFLEESSSSEIIEDHCCSPCGNYIAIARGERILKWDLRRKSYVNQSCRHDRRISNIEYSATESLVVSGSEDCTIKTWHSFGDGHMSETIRIDATTPASRVCLSPDNSMIASCSSDGFSFNVWNARNGQLNFTIPGSEKFEPRRHFAFDFNFQYLLSGSCNEAIQLWRCHEILSNDALPTRLEIPLKSVLHGHKDVIFKIQSLHKSPLFLSHSRDFAVQLWDASSQSAILHLKSTKHPVSIIATSPSEDAFLTVTNDGTATVWRIVPYHKKSDDPGAEQGNHVSSDLSPRNLDHMSDELQSLHPKQPNYTTTSGSGVNAPSEDSHGSIAKPGPISSPMARKPYPTDIPYGWLPQWSDEYSEWYYVNTHNNTSQWEKPTSDATRAPLVSAPTGPPPADYFLRSLSPEQENPNRRLDYEEQIKLLERQNKKRLLQARQEQDSIGGRSESYRGS